MKSADYKAGMMRASDLCNERAKAFRAKANTEDIFDRHFSVAAERTLIAMSLEILKEVKASS